MSIASDFESGFTKEANVVIEDSNDHSLSRRQRAQRLLSKGKILPAIDEYQKALDANPGNLLVANTLGDLYLRSGRIQDAISKFYQIAEAYRTEGHSLKSIAMFKKIFRHDPSHADAGMKLADLLAEQGRAVEAVQHYVAFGDSPFQRPNTCRSIEAYEKAIALDKNNATILMRLGDLYLEADRRLEAYDAFMKARSAFSIKGETEDARRADLKAQGIKFEGEDRPCADKYDRRTEGRLAHKIPMVVTCTNKWVEFTQTMDISASGARFRLLHSVDRGSTLNVQLSIPEEFGIKLGQLPVVVCHGTQDIDGTYLIGAQFGAPRKLETAVGLSAAATEKRFMTLEEARLMARQIIVPVHQQVRYA
jgi:tetratricopeptide (TPR) repeat protein